MTEKPRPCRKCGACDRYPSGDCRPCAKAYVATKYAETPKKIDHEKMRAYYHANKEAINKKRALYSAEHKKAIGEKSRAWVAANKERAAVTGEKWREKHRGEAVDRVREWRAANPEAVKIHASNRRARKIGNDGILSKGISEKLFGLQKGTCPCCAQPLGDDYHLDHIVPLALGGPNTDDNMQLLRAKCNLKKNAKHPVDFMQSRGFLL